MLIAFSLLPQRLPLSHFDPSRPFPHHFETASLFFPHSCPAVLGSRPALKYGQHTRCYFIKEN